MPIVTGQVWTHITSCQVALSVPQVCVIRKCDSHGLGNDEAFEIFVVSTIRICVRRSYIYLHNTHLRNKVYLHVFSNM